MIIPSIPLVDLHRHLDGNIAPRTILKLAQKHQLPLANHSLAEIEKLTQVAGQTSDLMAFLAKLEVGVSVLDNTDACYEVAYENMRDAQQSGLDYVELRFSPYFMARAHNLNLQAVVAAVINGVKDASHTFAVKANVIGTLSRTYGQRACMAELNALLAYKDDICALDLAGDELRYPAQQFVEHFSKARDAGWNITVHAGEADGPQSIWQAINLLGAKRIGHGVAATQDPKLMAYMAKHAIAVESCPTSNYQTSTISNIGDHPMKLFIEQGMLVTLNTDDPGVSNIDLRHEYNVAHKILGLSPEALQQIQSNGVLAAFLPEPDKQALWDKKSPK